MKYETMPLKPMVKIRRKAMRKQVTDMSKLTTLQILWYLVKRHHVDLLTLAVAAEFTLLIVT